jgi:hypothetical protein
MALWCPPNQLYHSVSWQLACYCQPLAASKHGQRLHSGRGLPPFTGRAAPDEPAACCRPLLESGDCWPMAILPTIQTFGGKPKPVAVFAGVTGGRYPPSAGYMLHTMAFLRGHRSCVADQPVGNLVGAIGWCETFGRSLCSWISRAGCFGTPLSVHFDRRLRVAGPARPSRGVPGTVVTWLILPVVICLSQRLSHACLSISNLYSETANGSLNQLSFI